MSSGLLSKLSHISYSIWKGFVALLAVQAVVRASDYQQSNNAASMICPVDELASASLSACLITSRLSTDDALPAITQLQNEADEVMPISHDLNKLLEKIKINKVVGGHEDFAVIAPGAQDKKRIKEALYKINNKNTLKILIDSDIKINIVPEAYMQNIVGIPDYSGCFLPMPYNSILLNEHLFTKQSKAADEQLITLLANELSHATIHNNHPDKASNQDGGEAFKSLVPWQTEAQRSEFIAAYDLFKANIEEYKKLIKKSKTKNLSKREKAKLSKYDAAMMSYITPRLGANGYNDMQVYFIKEGKKIKQVQEFANTIPEYSKVAERLEYLRNNFFHSLENKSMFYEAARKIEIGIYTNDDNQLFADLLSDFETLSPDMRKAFGEKLCNLLNNYFHTDNHCDRSNWPTPRAIM